MADIETLKNQKGYNTLILRLAAYAVTIAGIALTINGPSSIEGLNYLSWVAYPVFAYLLAMGFDKTSSRFRYFIRLVMFAVIAEIPYNFYTGGKLLNKYANNGMFTLILGFIVLWGTTFIHKKLNNLIISAAVCYGLGYGAYWVARHFNCEFYSFGVMLVVVFYVSRQVKYTKLLQLGFIAFLVFIITSETSINIILGNYQYSFPYRVFGVFSLLLIWFSSEERGPNPLWLKISMYLFYPVLLGVATLIKISL